MKIPFTVQLEKETRQNFEAVADAAHMDANKFAATWISELSTLRPEYALKVLGLIPDEWKKRRPGRPPSSTSRSDAPAVDQVPTQHVA